MSDGTGHFIWITIYIITPSPPNYCKKKPSVFCHSFCCVLDVICFCMCVINRRRRGAEKQTGKGPFFHDPSFSFSSRNSSIPTFIFLLCIVTDICFDSCVLILEAVHIHLHEARVWLLVKMFVCNSDFFFDRCCSNIRTGRRRHVPGQDRKSLKREFF